MAGNRKKALWYGAAFLAMVCFVNTAPLELFFLSNTNKLLLGISLVFLDFSHKYNPRIAIAAMGVGGLLCFGVSHQDFAPPIVVTYYFTFPLEMCVFHWWYHVKKRNFAQSMLLSNVVPSITDGVVWSLMLGSYVARWEYVVLSFVALAAIAVYWSYISATYHRYKILAGLVLVTGLGVCSMFTDSWVDPVAEGWGNWFIDTWNGLVGMLTGFFDLTLSKTSALSTWLSGLSAEPVSLANPKDLYYIWAIDMAVSAAYMLTPVAIFACWYAHRKRRAYAVR